MKMLKEDIAIAQQIVSLKFNNLHKKESYHNNSFIYKFTNEEIMNYQKYLKNRKKIFSITASSDQVLNSILEGSEEITSCDISRWPSYFYELKKAAVLSLTREEYIEFFISAHNDHLVFNDLLYDKLVDNLSEDARKFWDSLFLFFEGEDIYY